MIKQLKSFTVKLISGANVATVIIMLLFGYSGYVNPQSFSYLSFTGLLFPIFLVINLTFLFLWLIFKWRMIWIPVLGYILAYQPISIFLPINMPAAMPSGVIKVLSYNVCGYHDRLGNSTYETIYEYIKDSDASIVCFQEDSGIAGALRSKMKKLLGHSDTIVMGKGSFINGLGIYSRYPIIKKQRIHYESLANASAAFFLKVDGDTVIVINNHFESNHLSMDDRSRYKDMLKGEMDKGEAKAESKKLIRKLIDAAVQRAPQADAVREFIKQHSHHPIIVCGDFNDNPVSYTRRVVAEGLRDCFVDAGRGLGLTYNQKGFNVRIDNILCSQHYEPYNCKVDNKISVSDHYPISCWLKMQAK